MRGLVIIISLLMGITGWAQESEGRNVILITANSPEALSPKGLKILFKSKHTKKAAIIITRNTSPEITERLRKKIFEKSKIPALVLTIEDPEVRVATEKIKKLFQF